MTNRKVRSCRICGNETNNKVYSIKEMMYGSRETFEYYQCSKCSCLQIGSIPEDLNRHYPENYWYPTNRYPGGRFNIGLRKIVHRSVMTMPNKFHQVAYPALPLYRAPVWSGWNWINDFKSFGVTTRSAIMDIGCGNGTLLYFLKSCGYSNLFGVEPFFPSGLSQDGITVFNRELRDVTGTYDFMTLHHSFEHVTDPASFLSDLYRLLKPNRYLLIRIPVVTSYAWEYYRENWVQIDAPRHLFLHSPASMKILCENAGFRIRSIQYDSDEFQFLGSEQYKKNIPLKSFAFEGYGAREVKVFKRRSIALNREQKGDQACFYLHKQ